MIFQPTYFSPIYQFQQLVATDTVIFETQDNFQKQTYRTRCSIYGANGKLSLNIPIKHSKGTRQTTRDVKIENAFPWQKNHFKSIENAYRSSPYFEFYEDDLRPLYETEYKYLLDFLFKTQELSFELLQLDISYKKTNQYIAAYPQKEDFRFLAIAKSKQEFPVKEYTQVFQEKHGFIPNLSILDLLFNEGPNALSLLE
jgi:hypothetical protein